MEENYRPLCEKIARENISKAVTESNKNRNNPTLTKSSNLDQPINTRKEKQPQPIAVTYVDLMGYFKVLNGDFSGFGF